MALIQIKSSATGIMLLESDGVPSGLFTDVGVKIPAGSIALDTTKGILYQLIGGSWEKALQDRPDIEIAGNTDQDFTITDPESEINSTSGTIQVDLTQSPGLDEFKILLKDSFKNYLQTTFNTILSRINTNKLSVADLDALYGTAGLTTIATTLTEAINELNTNIDTNTTKIGASSLDTTATDLSAAINELHDDIATVDAKIPNGSGLNNRYILRKSSVSADDFEWVDIINMSFDGLPTSDPLISGRLWNDSGTLKVSL